MFTRCNALVFGLLVILTLPAGAETASDSGGPTAQFSWIGDVGEALRSTAADWPKAPAMDWELTTDLKPRFTYGPVVFLADTSWDIPMSPSLTPANVTMLVYEAYFRVTPTPGLDLTFGQKHYNLGVGQLVTVGDSINPVTGFFDQKTGFRGATAEWSPTSAASVSAALSTENNDLTGAGQVSLLLDALQLTGSLVADGPQGRTFNPALGTSYAVFGVILTGEVAAEFLPQGRVPSSASPGTWTAPSAWTQPAVSGTAGARYTFTIGDFDYTVAGQYLHWGQGWTTGETAAWNASGLTTRPGFPVRGQENAFLQLSAVSGTSIDISGLGVMDLQDQSVLAQGSAAWDPWDNVEFTLGFLVAEGTQGSTFAYLPQDAHLGITNATSRYQASFSTTYHF